MKKNYKTLGGWLLAFFIFRIIGVALGFKTFTDLLGYRRNYELFASVYGDGLLIAYYLVLLVSAVIIVANFIVVVSVLKKNKKSLALIKKILLISVILDVGSTLLFAGYMTATVGVNMFDSSTIGAIIGAVGGAIVWIAYLNESKRVAVYFDENYIDPEDVIEVQID